MRKKSISALLLATITMAPAAVIPATTDNDTIKTNFSHPISIKAGHQIRLEISSSNFPMFDRNPNTGQAFAQDADLQMADQTIYHDVHHPSAITLPIVLNQGEPDDQRLNYVLGSQKGDN